MNKTELMETYTAEQLADKVIELVTIIDDNLGCWGEQGISYNDFFSMQDENTKLKSEVEKYRKVIEDTKKEHNRQILEYQNKIDIMTIAIESLQKDSISVHQEPIDIANDLINANGEYENNQIIKAILKEDKGTYRIFDVSELRQIAEHLLVYCNHHGEAEE